MTARLRRAVLWGAGPLLVSTLFGCEGAIPGSSAAGGPGEGSGAGSSTTETLSFSCDAAAKQPMAALRRLTMSQYRNTLSDLATFALGDGTAALPEIESQLASLPEDRREPVPEDLHGSYRRLDQSVQQVHVDALYDLGVAAGKALTTEARLSTVVGSCATDTDGANDAACLDDFIQRFGARVLRRPLESDEVEFYRTVYGTDVTADPAAYADVIAVLLNSPQAVYFVEHGEVEAPDSPGVFSVSGYELASRLSYQLWQTAPDDALLAAAADGSLLTPDVYQAQLERLVTDPRARPTLQEFFADWMKVEDLPPLDAKVADPVFSAFAAGDLPGPGLRKAMIDDVLSLFDWYTWTEPSGLDALFSTDKSFAKSADLAKIYGVPAWDGSSEPPSFTSGERPGFLTRALFLSTGSPNTRPIMKGVFIRKHVLCDAIPPPPPGANAKPPDLEPGMTTRETVSAITEGPDSVCAGCHLNIINPLGFASEGFDALGRFRSEQQLFDAEGNSAGSKPVDTAVVPNVIMGDTTPAAGVADLMRLIRESGKVEACLSRNYFRFTFARWEDAAVDGCALEEMRKAIVSGSMKELLSAAALVPSFKQRAFE